MNDTAVERAAVGATNLTPDQKAEVSRIRDLLLYVAAEDHHIVQWVLAQTDTHKAYWASGWKAGLVIGTLGGAMGAVLAVALVTWLLTT